jgi:fatty-acyl-CoA synthase
MNVLARNPFASDWLRGGRDDRLAPPGALSYVAGATDEPLRFVTVSLLLDEAVAAHGAREAAVFCAEGARVAWCDLQRRADDVAGALVALGVGRG